MVHLKKIANTPEESETNFRNIVITLRNRDTPQCMKYMSYLKDTSVEKRLTIGRHHDISNHYILKETSIIISLITNSKILFPIFQVSRTNFAQGLLFCPLEVLAQPLS